MPGSPTSSTTRPRPRRSESSASRNAATSAEAAYSDTQSYTAVTVAALQAIEPNITFQAGAADATQNQVQVSGVTANGYTLASTSKSGKTFSYKKDITATPTVARTCAPGCPNW